MYYQYFGLNEAPFSIAVNPRYLFMSPRHRDALAHLLYGVGSGGGFILLTGEVGTGKTTINRCLLEQLPDDTDIAMVLNPALNAMELLATVCDELGIDYNRDRHTLKTLTDSLHRYLLDNHARGRKTVLLIDEAQHLDFDVLEQIRLLTNLETNSEKLLQIILIGQPELAQLLQRPELRQLNQRITARYNLQPLNLEETRAYIRHRLQVAGLAPGRELFPGSVVKGIYKRTRGIPRLINVLSDRMLLGAYGRNRDRVDSAMLALAAREVMGEEPGMQKGGSTWFYAIAVAAALGVALWWFYPRVTPPVETAVQVPEAVAPASVASLPEPSPTVSAATTSLWLLSVDSGYAGLWALASEVLQPLEQCSQQLVAGVSCVTGKAETWQDVLELDRPLLLDMVTPERFSATALLLDVRGRDAIVATSDGGVQTLPLADLGVQWSGGYHFLWHPPEGFEQPLARGDSDPAVAAVASLFARLDQQGESLSGHLFTAALEQRVLLFQQQYGLKDDGVVGRQTLLKLNELLAIDVTRAEAVARLTRSAAETSPDQGVVLR
jgi:general secretion pathway protein A